LFSCDQVTERVLQGIAMKMLLIGKTSQLGADIVRNNRDHEIIAIDTRDIDMGLRDSTNSAIQSHRPEVIINTTAFDDVLLCETDPMIAFAVNCLAVRDLAIAGSRVGAVFVTFSTDYVFDGEKRALYREDDKPMPLQLYGISRLAGEYAALSAAVDCTLIIRTCGLYGLFGTQPAGGNFVDKRIQDAKARTPLEMGSDQVVSPTYSHDLSKAVLALLEHPQRGPGIYHLVNEGKCSWYEFTKAIYEIMGITATLKPVDRGGKIGDMKRPLYSALANTKARALGIILPHWRDALERYLQEKYGIGEKD
jgi:dTDP-4-dehydrorhamnose reductase